MTLKVDITDGTTLDIDDESIECYQYLLNRGKIMMSYMEIPDEIKNEILESRKPGYIIKNPDTGETYRKGFLDNYINELCNVKGLKDYKSLIFTHSRK